MSEPRAGPLGRLTAWVHKEWAWLAAALVVAGATLVALLVIGAYQNAQVTTASAATKAELAASRINAIEWKAIAFGQLTPGLQAEIRRLQTELTRHVSETGPQADPARTALLQYTTDLRTEFGLIAAGDINGARQFDQQAVDLSFTQLERALRREAAARTNAAQSARRAAVAEDIVAFLLGFGAVAVLLRRFANVRRALATAEVEQRVLQETSKAKSDLISVVSHDLRTPLTSIVGYLEILSEEDAGPISEEQKQFLSIIQRNADRLLTIVNDLLFISSAEERRLALAMTEIDLAEAAADAVEAQQLLARAHDVELRALADPVPGIMADRGRVDELIENLLSNAIKFTPAGGSVRVSVGPAGGRVRLEVSDTGVGISPADQEHLFERFFRAPAMLGTPGTGLGLAIVKAIADAHEASLEVRSALGEGATFRVDFPPASAFTGAGMEPAGS